MRVNNIIKIKFNISLKIKFDISLYFYNFLYNPVL